MLASVVHPFLAARCHSYTEICLFELVGIQESDLLQQEGRGLAGGLSGACQLACCAVLCCAVLCCAVLCCAVLCCAVLCCAVLYTGAEIRNCIVLPDNNQCAR